MGVVTTIHYGVLEKILVCTLGPEDMWGSLRWKTLLLALITPFKTNGKDAALHTIYYKDCGTSIITDLRNIKSSIGRVETRKRWGLIDRDIEHIRPAFQVADTGEESDEEDGSDVAG